MATETWVINETPTADAPDATITFRSNNTLFASMTFISKQPMLGKSEWYYGNTLVADGYAGDVLTFTDQAYRTVTFETAPTDALLTWLQANATKQETPTVHKVNVDLTTLPGWSALPAKTYNITIVAKANGYRDSEPSAAVSVEKTSANLLTDSGGNILQDSNGNNLEFKEA